MKDCSVFLDTRRWKNWTQDQFSLQTCPASFPDALEGLISALRPELLRGGVEGQ